MDLTTGVSRVLPAFPRMTGSLCFSPDSTRLIADCFDGNAGGMIKIWDVASGKELRHVSPREYNFGWHCAISPGGQLLFAVKDQAIHAYAFADLVSDARLNQALAAKNAAALALAQAQRYAVVEERKDGSIHVFANDTATDADLAQLRGLDSVTDLRLILASKVTNAGLAIVKDLPNLQVLHLNHAQLIGDDALVHLKDAANLRELWLNDTKMTDAGMAHLAGLTKLRVLKLESTQITDVGMSAVKNM